MQTGLAKLIKRALNAGISTRSLIGIIKNANEHKFYRLEDEAGNGPYVGKYMLKNPSLSAMEYSKEHDPLYEISETESVLVEPDFDVQRPAGDANYASWHRDKVSGFKKPYDAVAWFGDITLKKFYDAGLAIYEIPSVGEGVTLSRSALFKPDRSKPKRKLSFGRSY